MATTWLYDANGGRPVAWSTDGEWFYTASKTEILGWKDGQWLYERGSGQPLGWFDGDWFYEHGSGKPLYFLREE